MKDILTDQEIQKLDVIASKILSEDIVSYDDIKDLEKKLDAILPKMGIVDKFFERIL